MSRYILHNYLSKSPEGQTEPFGPTMLIFGIYITLSFIKISKSKGYFFTIHRFVFKKHNWIKIRKGALHSQH
jgi:hypothetical protein